MSAEMLLPTARGRIKLALIYGAAAVWTYTFPMWWRPLMDHMGSLPPCEQIHWARALVILFGATFVVAGLGLLRHARKLLTHHQSPLPDALVFFPTHVRRGWTIIAEARALQIFGVLMLAAPIIGWGALDLSPLFWAVPNCE